MKKADSRPLLLSSINDYFVPAGARSAFDLLEDFADFFFLVVFFFSAFGASAAGAPEGAGAWAAAVNVTAANRAATTAAMTVFIIYILSCRGCGNCPAFNARGI
jgi:hypothetical protein